MVEDKQKNARICKNRKKAMKQMTRKSRKIKENGLIKPEEF